MTKPTEADCRKYVRRLHGRLATTTAMTTTTIDRPLGGAEYSRTSGGKPIKTTRRGRRPTAFEFVAIGDDMRNVMIPLVELDDIAQQPSPRHRRVTPTSRRTMMTNRRMTADDMRRAAVVALVRTDRGPFGPKCRAPSEVGRQRWASDGPRAAAKI